MQTLKVKINLLDHWYYIYKVEGAKEGHQMDYKNIYTHIFNIQPTLKNITHNIINQHI